MILGRAFAIALLATASLATASTGPSDKGRRSARPAKSAFRADAKWRLGDFLELSRRDPDRLVKLGKAYFSEDRLRRSSRETKLVFEWQDRIAIVGALSDFFDPAAETALGARRAHFRKEAKALLVRAVLDDTSLLVRDAAVEAIRRVQRMQPGLNRDWLAPLVKAFEDDRNVIEGEGLFIRETILTALREGSHPLSAAVRRSARRDRNPQVRELIKAWDTSAYGKL